MATIKRNSNTMGLPMNITRGNPIPLDSTSVWYSYQEALEYAQSGATAYVGQIISVVDESSNTTNLYVIQNVDGDLKLVNYSGSSSDANKGKLTIGSHVYDGTTDVTIGLYDGAIQE